MPSYDYGCPKCGRVEEHVHGMTESPEIKCGECGAVTERIFSPNIGGFILKGGTSTTHYKEKRLRQKRSEKMAARQKERYGTKGPRSLPNIAGHETGTWANAHEIAKEIKNETGISTEGYAKMAEKEGSKKIIVATH